MPLPLPAGSGISDRRLESAVNPIEEAYYSVPYHFATIPNLSQLRFYAQIVQAERHNDVAEIWRLLPECERLWPGDLSGYLRMLRGVAGWADARGSSGAIAGELLALGSNILSQALKKEWPKDGHEAAACLGCMADIIERCIITREGTKEAMPPSLLLELADWAGKVRSNIVPVGATNAIADSPDPATITSTEDLQKALREANVRTIERTLMGEWGKIPADTPDNKRFLEKVATAARLRPEEREKLGLR